MDKHTINLFRSKKTDDWRTPPEIYDPLNEEFNFTLDPCPINPISDGLKISWSGSVFVNPPYSQVYKWLQKAHNEISNCDVIVFLVFANTDTKWFHELVYHKADEIRFLRGRVKFLDRDGNRVNSAMRPSMVVVFRGSS